MKIYKKKKRKGAVAFLAAAVLFALFVGLDMSMRPIVESVIEYQARVFATRLVNEAMAGQLSENEADYDALVKITRGPDGNVASIEADMLQINKLKMRMGRAVVEKLESGKDYEIEVPLGTIVGNQFTSGRGPNVAIKVIPAGYVQSEIQNRFSSAGINQTLHQIMLKANVQIIAILPGYSVKTETSTNFCIAETVIVGGIPQGYAAVEMGAPTFAPVAP